MGQRSGDKEGAAEAYLAGQVEILAKVLNNRSLSETYFGVCVCVTVFPLTPTFCVHCVPFWGSCRTQLNFFNNRNSRNRGHWGGKDGKDIFTELLLPCLSSLAPFFLSILSHLQKVVPQAEGLVRLGGPLRFVPVAL